MAVESVPSRQTYSADSAIVLTPTSADSPQASQRSANVEWRPQLECTVLAAAEQRSYWILSLPEVFGIDRAGA